MLHHQVGVLRGGTRIRESHIDPASSVRENIIELLRRSSDCANPDEEVGVWLTDYDLTEVADSLPDKLGSGARRRLALALALAWDPALVVVDDPGEAFDYVHRGLLVKAFKKWHVRTGATVLITLHSLELAKILGHQVAVLRDGRVLAQGIPARVLDGVIDDETFEARFHTGLGGVAEADSLRLGNLRTDAVRWGGNYLDLGRPLRRAR
jgi:ABC-type multidrug transport system ATPase subunit